MINLYYIVFIIPPKLDFYKWNYNKYDYPQLVLTEERQRRLT